MRRNLYFMILTSLTLTTLAGENLVKNGDFEKGRSGWSGDLKPASEGENKIVKLELEDDEEVSFYQRIVMRDPKDLIIRFKMKKSDDYKGNDRIAIGFEGKNGSIGGWSRILPDSNEWMTIEYKFENIGLERLKIHFRVEGSQGVVFFDDIEIVEAN